MPQKAPDSPEYRPSSPQDTPHSPGYTPASPKVDFSSPSSAVLPSDPTWTSRRNQKSPDSAQKLPYLPPELLSEISNYTRHRPSPSKDQKVDDGELPGQPSKPFILQQQQQRQQQQYQLQQQQPIQQQQKQQQLIEQQRIQQQIQQLIERQRILQQQQQQNAFRPDEVTLPKDFNPGLTEPYRGVFGAPERLPGSYGSTDDQPSSPTASDISRRLGLVRQIRGGELPSSVAYIPPGAELFEPNTGNTNISQGPDFLFQKLRSTDGRSAEQIRAARRGARRHQALGNRPPSVTPQVGEGIVGADMAGEEAGSRSRSRVRNDSQTIPETTEAPIPGEPQADSSSAPPRQSSYTPPPAPSYPAENGYEPDITGSFDRDVDLLDNFDFDSFQHQPDNLDYDVYQSSPLPGTPLRRQSTTIQGQIYPLPYPLLAGSLAGVVPPAVDSAQTLAGGESSSIPAALPLSTPVAPIHPATRRVGPRRVIRPVMQETEGQGGSTGFSYWERYRCADSRGQPVPRGAKEARRPRAERGDRMGRLGDDAV